MVELPQTVEDDVVRSVLVVHMTMLATVCLARPPVDCSPDRSVYQVKPCVCLVFPGVRGKSWIPATPDGSGLPLVGTLRPRDAAEVGDAGWVICPGAFERGFSIWEEQRDYIRPLGIKYLRVQVSWAKTEPEKGKFDFSWLDDVVDFCEKNGISPIFETSYGNPIHEGGGGATLRGKLPSGPGLAKWDDWIDRLTRRYGACVKEWAGWNEPDIDRLKYATVEEIAAFCLRTAKIIRRNVPDARIAGLSLAETDPQVFDRILELTGEDVKIYDSVIYHGYRTNPESLYDEVDAIRLAVARRAPHLKLWQGENGCPSDFDDNGALSFYAWTELSQAKWDMRRMIGDFARGIRCSLFVLTDFQRPGKKTQNHKGLLRIDGNLKTIAIKPAYYAAQNVTSVFDSEVTQLPNRPTSERDDIEAFAFLKRGKPMLAFWQNGRKTEAPDGATFRQGAALSLIWRSEHAFEDPVWVDLLSGRVYSFPKRFIRRENGVSVFCFLPLIDSPTLLTERLALDLQ